MFSIKINILIIIKITVKVSLNIKVRFLARSNEARMEIIKCYKLK